MSHEDLQMRLERLSRHSVPSLIAELAERSPDRLALSVQSVRGSRDRLTFRQVEILANRVGGDLLNLGILPGDRVATFLTNEASREFFLTALGALAAGIVAVPLNTRSSDHELRHALQLVAPRAIATTTSCVGRIRQLAGPEALILTVDGEAPSALKWPEPEFGTTPAVALPAIDPDSLGCLLFTSGTTGFAKAVASSHRTMISTGLCTGNALGLRATDIYQCGFPVFTSSALNLALMSCWVAGSALIFEGAVDNHQRLTLIAGEGTTYYHGVPAVLNFMMRDYNPAIHDLSGLRRVANGGAAMPPAVIESIRRHLPGVEQVQIYGLTESGPAGTVLELDRHDSPSGAVGKAMQLCHVSIVDDTWRTLPDGEMGEIVISGPGVALGYYRNGEATEAAFRNRAVRTGDVGRLDKDGYLYFGDRKKDIINRGGLKIASVAVEHVLHDHPAVHEAAVVAVVHPDLGEDIGALIVLHPGQQPDVASLKAFCAGRLADYEVPRQWRFAAELPKSPMGKVLKNEVRTIFATDPS